MIDAWSYSRLKDFETCPAYAFWAHSKKSEHKGLRQFGRAAKRGTQIHEEGEKWLLGKRVDLPEAYDYVRDEMEEIKELGAIPEGRWTFTDKWKSTDWFGKDAWLRLAIDARVEKGKTVQTAIDFKTGKVYDDHVDQLELYGLAVFKRMPKVRKVELEAWYLDQGFIQPFEPVERKHLRALTKKWTDRAAKLLTAEDFPATPCWKCRFCDFAKSKGGPCTEG